MPPLRLIHASDVHVWKHEFNPMRLMNKRLVGMASLLLGRARRFRLERLGEVVERIRARDADHLLITGDLTTTAMTAEFHQALEALAPLLGDPSRATVIPGNHDRYTGMAFRENHFERAFGRFMGAPRFPWIKFVAEKTAVLGLDPTRAALHARGHLPLAQLDAARKLWEEHRGSVDRLIVACHYPTDAPPALRRKLDSKRLDDAPRLAAWLATLGPHLFCCGHVHHAWAFTPPDIPDQLCLNAGAPLLRDETGKNPPGFLEIVLDGPDVDVIHHAWTESGWTERRMERRPGFFAVPTRPIQSN
ncbi:metallophosphoesterase family protein [Planctomyces sp. SH-PL62]|uniref:metallophosphoesterase family protein n=1 Tax=Planctomyces sp. SH-PL62 TaxID=1636152 RepID=UPI00078EA63C|nr:metallophosphoesterase [Planctomyces sp. SH-PL62]AMV36677.1 Calcineurin-like phosphoesterase superfamily domain protein [Planctomyces sp. SH-PL62]